jgi:hypothetical protein
LIYLHAGGNRIHRVPAGIGKLRKLTELGLGENELTHLPPKIAKCRALTRLGLAGNRLAHLPPELGGLERLQSLNVEHNCLERLPLELARAPSLLLLRIEGNPITETPEALQSLILQRRELVFGLWHDWAGSGIWRLIGKGTQIDAMVAFREVALPRALRRRFRAWGSEWLASRFVRSETYDFARYNERGQALASDLQRHLEEHLGRPVRVSFSPLEPDD